MATITEDYVSFEVAKLLKKKGFPQSTFRCHYIIDGNSHYKRLLCSMLGWLLYKTRK